MLRFCDGFDHTTDYSTNTKWTTGSSLGFSTTSPGRFGVGRKLNLVGYDSRSLRKTLDSQPTWILGVAFRHTSASFNGAHLFEILDSNTRQLELGINSSGLMVVTRNGTTLATGTAVLSPGLEYYVEFKATIHNSTGLIVTRLDGNVDINSSGIDTQNTANASANQVQLGQHDGGFTVTAELDDFYVCDGVDSGVPGAPNDDFLGDVLVPGLFADGTGNYSDFLGSDSNSINNYLLVDETDPNGDTDYVESGTVTDTDTYTFADLSSSSGTVYGVQILPYARKTSAGTRELAAVARLAGTDDVGASNPLSSSYKYYPDMREADPAGNQWTITNVNSAEFGGQVSA